MKNNNNKNNSNLKGYRIKKNIYEKFFNYIILNSNKLEVFSII